LISGAGIIAFLLVGLARGGGLWTEYTPLSTSGTRYLAGTHAFYLVLSLMLGVSLLAFKRLRSIGFATMIAIFWVLGISLSLMRHLWLDAVFSLSLLFLLLPRPNQKELYKYVSKAALGLATVFALLTLSAGLFYLSGFSESFRDQAGNLVVRGTSLLNLGEDTSATWRLQLWYDAREAWNKNRFFGLGFGKTILIDTGDWQNFEEVRNMHNSMLALLVQMGFLGFSFFVALIAVSGFYAIKRIYQNEELTPYYLGISAGCATFLFASLFQPYLETNLMGIFFWIFLGLLRTSAIINKDEDTANQ
jgi:O-antigen ligase